MLTISKSANAIRKINNTRKERGRFDGNVINLSDLTTVKKTRMHNAASLFLTAEPRLSDVARVSDNSSAMRKQIAECFLAFDNLGPMRKQIIECSSPIRQFLSTVLSEPVKLFLYSRKQKSFGRSFFIPAE